MNTKYYIGQHIKIRFGFPMTCSERFIDIQPNGLNLLAKTERATGPAPNYVNSWGFVIGLKRAIMSEYSYTSGYNSQGFEDAYPEHVRAYARGKYEECLICVQDLKPFKPFLVRKKDVLG